MRYLIITAIFITVLIGCSGNEAGLTVPDNPAQNIQGNADTLHGLWGYWQGVIDAEAGTLEFIQLRAGAPVPRTAAELPPDIGRAHTDQRKRHGREYRHEASVLRHGPIYRF